MEIKSLGFQAKLVRLVEMTWKGTKFQIRFGGSLSIEFEITGRLKQGHPLSPIIFNLVLEKTIREIKTNPKGNIYNRLAHPAYDRPTQTIVSFS